MRRLRIENPLVVQTYRTFIGADYTPSGSGTSLQVVNSTSFSANDLLIVGEPSEELTEEKKLSSVASVTGLTLASALNFSHPKGTTIYKVLWDFVSIESASAAGGTFAEITQSPIQWDNKNNETVYYDPNGTELTVYRFRFYNSITTSYAEYSPTITGSGFTKAQVGYMLRNVRASVNDKERKIVTDDEIIRFFNLAQDMIYGHNPKYWFLLVDTYKAASGFPTVGGTDVYSLASYTDYGHLRRVRFNYNNGAQNILYDLENQVDLEFDAQTENLLVTGNDYTESYKLIPADSLSAQGYIQIFPKPINSSVGTIYPQYYRLMPTLKTVQDSTVVPLPSLLENFAIAQVEKIKGNDAKVSIYEDMFYGIFITRRGYVPLSGLGGLSLLDAMDEANKRPQGQPRSLSNFRGQTGGSRYYGRRGITHDQAKEWGLDDYGGN